MNTPKALELQPVRHTGLWRGYLILLGEFPLQGDAREQYRTALASLVQMLRGDAPHRTVVLQCDQLYKENAVRLLAKHGQLWQPEMGLGVYPDQPPPAELTGDAFLDQEFSAEIPMLKHTAAVLECDEAGATHAQSAMAGSGGLIQALHQTGPASLMDTWRNVLLRPIADEGFRAYTAYVPLFNAASLAALDDAVLDEVMHDCEVYLRESFEDKALLVLSKHPVEAALAQFAQDAVTADDQRLRLVN